MTRPRRTLLAAAACPAASLFATRAARAGSLHDAVADRPQLGIFASIVRRAGVAGELRSHRGITLFAPTNAAFEALPGPTFRHLVETASAPEAAAFVRAHVAAWPAPIPADAATLPVLRSLGGVPMILQTAANEAVRVNGRRIQELNIRAENGFLHIVSEVLVPP